MPSTYSTRLRLELQAAGENASTWGDNANTVFRRLEESITGLYALNVGTSVSSPIALTYNNGSSDQARYAYLNVTGQLASSVPIQVSAIDKAYWINNQTSGSQLLFGVVGKSNVTVPSGWVHVITDGSASWVAAAPVSTVSALTYITEASASAAFAFKGLANTFLSQQTFQSSVVVSGAGVFASILSHRGPLTSPPSTEIYATEPAYVSATAGALTFAVQDLIGTKTQGGGVRLLVESAQAASVQTRLDLMAKASNGSPTPGLHIGRGVWTPGVSGGDKGAGTINASNIYVEGAPVLTSATTPNVLQVGTTLTLDPIAINTKTTQAHALAGTPTLFETFLENKTAELGFTTGQKIALHGSVFITNGVNVGIQVWADATNTYLAIANNGLPSFVDGTNNPPGAVTAITAANWLVRVIPIRRT